MKVGVPLASVDEANFVLDHPGQVNVFLVAGLLAEGGFVGAGGTLDIGALRCALRARIAALPQLRRVAVKDGRGHRWLDVSPDLDDHVRLSAPVDGLAGLERLCGELMSVPLPMDRPLWELLIVPGARVAGIGVVLRIHHAVADGLAAVSIVQKLFDPTAASVLPAPHQAPVVANPARGLRSILSRFIFGLTRIRMTLGGREVGSTILLGERGPHRGVAFLSVDLAAVEAHARTSGATVNDALLAAAAAGYRSALAAAGEVIPARLTVSVPVALPRRGTAANHVGVMLVRLPLAEPDADERLRLVAMQTRPAKIKAREQGTLEFMRGPLGARLMDHLARRQHLVAGFVTDVPGPTGNLHLAGAPVAALWPVAVLAANVRLGVAAISYAGRLWCGVHFDADIVPGDAFSRAMGEELTRLG